MIDRQKVIEGLRTIRDDMAVVLTVGMMSDLSDAIDALQCPAPSDLTAYLAMVAPGYPHFEHTPHGLRELRYDEWTAKVIARARALQAAAKEG
jgi:hypothetical protein